jgi:hypothetical protein
VSIWDRFVAWLNAEEAPRKIAASPTSTLDPETERFLQQVETKLDRTVQDLSDGLINRAQFENLYRHYQNQRRMLQGLLAEGGGHVPDSLTDGESMVIRHKYAAKVLAYAVYDNESSVPLHTMGNFPVDSDLVVGFLSGFRSAAAEILGAGAAKAEAEVDVRSLRHTHLHFETLNDNLLKQRPIPADKLFFNYDMVLKLSSQPDDPTLVMRGRREES